MIRQKALTPAQHNLSRRAAADYATRYFLPYVPDRMPLFIGRSGSGKTTCMEIACRMVSGMHHRMFPGSKVEILPLNAANWAVIGSHCDPATLQLVVERLSALTAYPDSLLIIAIDEIDKLQGLSTSDHSGNGWFLKVFQEVQDLISKNPSALNIPRSRRGKGDNDAVAVEEAPASLKAQLEGAFFMGAGAFQGAFKRLTGQRPSIGFHTAAQTGKGSPSDEVSFTDADQLLRFDGNDLQLFSRCSWHFVPPPTEEELRVAAEHMIPGSLMVAFKPALEKYIQKAAASEVPFRSLETLIRNHCCNLLLKGELLLDFDTLDGMLENNAGI